MAAFLRFADLLLLGAKWATILLMAGMTVSILLGVFFRFVILSPLSWPPEVARFMMVAITMIGGSVAVRQLDHVGITFVVDMLSQKLRLALYVTGMIFIAAFLIILTIYGLRLTFEAGPLQRSPTLGISMAIVFVSLPLGAFMMLVQLGASIAEGIARVRGGTSPFDPGETVT